MRCVLVLIALAASLLAAPARAQEAGAEMETGVPAVPAPFFSVTLDMAEEAVARAVEAETGGKEQNTVQVRLYGNRSMPLYQADKPLTLEVKTLKRDEDGRRLSANLLIQSRGEVLTALPLTGRYDTMVLLPVLKERVLPGQTITADKITTQRFGSHAARDSTVTDAAQLIGRSPKRGVSAGRPIRVYELTTAAAIHKGEGVTLTFGSGGLSITAQGEALEDGAVGDSIRVRNTDSARVVRGIVGEGKTVQVASGVQPPAPSSGNAKSKEPLKGEEGKMGGDDRTIEDLFRPSEDEDWYHGK